MQWAAGMYVVVLRRQAPAVAAAATASVDEVHVFTTDNVLLAVLRRNLDAAYGSAMYRVCLACGPLSTAAASQLVQRMRAAGADHARLAVARTALAASPRVSLWHDME